MNTGDIIKQKLQSGLQGAEVTVIDESHKHAGHSGSRPGGNTHYAVTIIAEEFANMPRIARHKLVYKILGDELKNGVHALQITTLAPGE